MARCALAVVWLAACYGSAPPIAARTAPTPVATAATADHCPHVLPAECMVGLIDRSCPASLEPMIEFRDFAMVVPPRAHALLDRIAVEARDLVPGAALVIDGEDGPREAETVERSRAGLIEQALIVRGVPRSRFLVVSGMIVVDNKPPQPPYRVSVRVKRCRPAPVTTRGLLGL